MHAQAGFDKILMNYLIPIRHFDPTVLEFIDRTDNDPDLLRDDLKNLRDINRYWGGLSAIRGELVPFLAALPSQREVRILDLATGSADHPIAITKLAQRMQRSATILAVDKNPQILEIARERTDAFDNITIEKNDILALPYADQSFDVVIASLIIHHLSEGDAIRLLSEMKRLGRMLCIVNDLHRSWPAFGLAWIFAHISTRNPLSQNDAPVSVLRAFRAPELRAMAAEAGLANVTIKRSPFCRLLLVAENGTSSL